MSVTGPTRRGSPGKSISEESLDSSLRAGNMPSEYTNEGDGFAFRRDGNEATQETDAAFLLARHRGTKKVVVHTQDVATHRSTISAGP